MKTKIKITLISFLLAFSFSGFSQTKLEKGTFEEAEYYFASEDYVGALSRYLTLFKRGFKDNANINYRIGICYLNSTTTKEKAISYLETAVKKVSDKYNEGSIKEINAPVDAYLFLGNALRINMQLDKAIEAYEKYVSLPELKKEKASNLNKKWALSQIECCKRAKNAITKPVRIKTTILDKPINTSAANFDPVVTINEDKLIYITHQKFYDALMEVVKVNNKWSSPVNITPDIQSDGNQYPCFLTQDGKTLYLSKQENDNSDIYITHIEGKTWTPSIPLNKEINTKYWESHACVSPDGKTLYFVSDRPQSIGGTDIFVSEIGKNNDWVPAVNIGNTINTEFNEESPFISADGKTLYFSSQGHESLGGYDIFYSTKDENGKWSKPVNLGYPINSTDDDMFFDPLGDGSYAYQAKYLKNGVGDLDIVRIEIFSKNHPFKFGIQGNTSEIFKGSKPDDFTVLLSKPENNLVIDSMKPSKKGSFEFNQVAGIYQVQFVAKEFKSTSKSFEIPEDYSQDDFVLTPEMLGVSEQYNTYLASKTTADKSSKTDKKSVAKLNEKKNITEGSVKAGIVSDILFPFNDCKLSVEADKNVQNLITIMKENPSMEIEVLGFTDSQGKDSYNNKLSKKRAKNIRDQLVDAGISSGRIAFKGLGKTNPIAINENADGTDNPDGRAFNRRVEFNVLKCDNKNIAVKHIEVPDNLKAKK